MTDLQGLKGLSPRDLAMLGLNDVAYVKTLIVDDERVYAVHAADGTEMAVMADRDTAFAAILQHDMTALSVH